MASVRSRLALALALAFIVPTIAAVVALGILAPGQVKTSARQTMAATSAAVGNFLLDDCRSFGESARALALQSQSDRLSDEAASAIAREPQAFAAVLGTDDAVLGSAGTLPPDLTPAQLRGLPCTTSPRRVLAPRTASGPPVVVAVVPALTVSGTPSGTVVVGKVVDRRQLQAYLARLGALPGTAAALACPEGRGVSTVADTGVDQVLRQAAAAGTGTTEDGKWQVAASAVRGPGQLCSVASARQAGISRGQLLGIGALLLAGLLGSLYFVRRFAEGITSPLLAVTEAAERVARGDLSTRLPDHGIGELDRLSGAFNHMTDEVSAKVGELESSRDLLRENVGRLGDTLQRTHDLDGLLMTVLGAAASATVAQRATVWLVEGGSVVSRVSAPAGARRPRVRRLPLGQQLAGQVAEDGAPRRVTNEGRGRRSDDRLEDGPSGDGERRAHGASAAPAVPADIPEQNGRTHHGDEGGDPSTPLGGPALAAPLRRGPAVLGVIVVERSPGQPAFDADDEAMLVSLAGPAGIAVDNVLLHREAQRLSITDPLTGAGNLRHMTTTLARETERASRFRRPLSLLLLDLDHFKTVNDTFGHTVGDAVLREFARRLGVCVREVDVVARYGGEEFVVVAPETDIEGALRLAQRICDSMRSEPFRVGQDVVSVTVSVGIASLPLHGTASGDLVRAADEGLYAAKRAGRDQYRVAPSGETASTSDLTADR